MTAGMNPTGKPCAAKGQADCARCRGTGVADWRQIIGDHSSIPVGPCPNCRPFDAWRAHDNRNDTVKFALIAEFGAPPYPVPTHYFPRAERLRAQWGRG
jgi:hypothetical protein